MDWIFRQFATAAYTQHTRARSIRSRKKRRRDDKWYTHTYIYTYTRPRSRTWGKIRNNDQYKINRYCTGAEIRSVSFSKSIMYSTVQSSLSGEEYVQRNAARASSLLNASDYWLRLI